MGFGFGRFPDVAEVTIDRSLCTKCGLCAKVCSGKPLDKVDGEIVIDQTNLWGCIACGQCVCVCPTQAISVNGRNLSPDDLREFPHDSKVNYDSLMATLLARRSVRKYTPEDVSDDDLAKILEAVSTAPMGLPPSEVQVKVFKGRKAVQSFAGDIIDAFQRSKWIVSPLGLALMRLTSGKEAALMMKGFMKPAIDYMVKHRENGEDWLLYNAPMAFYFYASASSDPADPIIAATYAMIAAESLGLGTIMIGTPAYMLRYDPKMRAKYGMPKKHIPGVVLLTGHSDVKFLRGIHRKLAGIQVYE
jgi:nitroreductase/ferredoxin